MEQNAYGSRMYNILPHPANHGWKTHNVRNLNALDTTLLSGLAVYGPIVIQ